MNKFRAAVLGGAGSAPSSPLVTAKSGGKAESERIASVEIMREAGRSTDHRDEDRHRLTRETATIAHQGKRLDVYLVNLSGGGAMVEADFSPRLWDRVDLYLGEGSPIECAVRWLRGDRVGLEFAHETRIECAAEERDALLLNVIRRSFPQFLAAARSIESRPAVDVPPEHASRRDEFRHPLIWNGEILWEHDVHLVRLRNISASGALIDAQIGFPEGVELLLDLGASGQYFATVSWSRGSQTGLSFRSAFDLSRLADAKPEVASLCWDRPTYLDRSSGQASPWASEWERSPLSDLASDLEGFLKR